MCVYAYTEISNIKCPGWQIRIPSTWPKIVFSTVRLSGYASFHSSCGGRLVELFLCISAFLSVKQSSGRSEEVSAGEEQSRVGNKKH